MTSINTTAACATFIIGVLATVSIYTPSLKAADEGKSINQSETPKMISLAEAEPAIYYSFRRYSKFYGDSNTNIGELLERSQLLGSLGGFRDTLVDNGIYFDMSVTQFMQGNVSGGDDTGAARHNGSADYWLTLDSGKAGLWSGGALFMHAESSWEADDSVNPDVASLLPANFDATMPTPNDAKGLVLPEVYIAQALPGNILALAGKLDWAGLADTNVFANNERTQFSYTGLVNNPILGSFAPYTSIGAAGSWSPGEHNLTIFALQSNGDATTSGFDDFNGEYSYGVQYQFSPIVDGNLPGNYRFIGAYSSKDMPEYAISTRHLIGELLDVTPVADEDENYTALFNFDQYLWVEDASVDAYKKRMEATDHPGVGRHHLPPNGIGIFARAGWAPNDRNVIDQFYSMGIGGYGMLIPGRDYDQWGLGWTGTHISSDFRDDAEVLDEDFNTFEHAIEAYYNFRVTSAAQLSVNAQAIDLAADENDTAFTIGTRLQVDF